MAKPSESGLSEQIHAAEARDALVPPIPRVFQYVQPTEAKSCPGTYCRGHYATHERCDKPWPPLHPVKPKLKARLELVPFDFIIEMAFVLQAGLSDSYDPPRKPGDWQKYTASELEERRGSLLRHYGNGEWAAVAVNAAILWWHDRRTK